LALKGLKPNSIGNYLRSLRALFNKAIKAKIVDRSYYPFFDISIRTEKTQKRAILKEDISKLEKLELKTQSKEWHARNYFLLSYYLRGISFTDLAYLTDKNLVKGRVTYRRRKTHKLYSIKKAELILDIYRSTQTSYLLPVIHSSSDEDSIVSKKLIAQWIKL
jgi:integrase/recombinase XerD